ncbi:uncharacterized protein MICPUCDRAFT_34980 [Micromonas pusilla CCMP1545]|uniref:Predicted protein n=1 Tax=Micromonas pusilla (strain CCMP1545) TaxID=564608 RepID=C1MZH6_MICPC|nr:uncharacterized protein MICPUCDRAFT_34980 [Micromonas pusilla CCMP1545]EEH54871.1 predicted protein [Micromonas pusilla CCMP1545]|eukprot:XP_003061221.1 predicted protein [Micromonas pusilla CCMP1545]
MECPTFCVWGANTAVGKTLVSKGLAEAAARRSLPCFYLKPVQTGFPDDSDADFVARGRTATTMGAHAAVAAGIERGGTSSPIADGSGGDGTWSHTEFAWARAVGPHLAAREEGRGVADSEVLRAVTAQLSEFSDHVGSALRLSFTSLTGDERPSGVALVETAGGVCSPAPSGALQCDVLRPLRLPAILVGDPKLGGISTTIASLETLAARGYDVVAIVMSGSACGNVDAVEQYASEFNQVGGGEDARGIPTFALPPVPERRIVGDVVGHGREIYEWLDDGRDVFDALLTHATSWHRERVRKMRTAPDEALRTLWWPFTQHDATPRENVTVIDSRCGEDFGVYSPDSNAIELRFDGAASWWTQGASKAEQTRLVRAASAAAGRYGHVMFPENVHAPALDAASELLKGAGRDWATRVFYSDNGSTAMEVAVKMAIRTYFVRKGFIPSPEKASDAADFLPQVRVLALDGSYHGDTLGTMDMQAPSVFTGPLQTPWYKPRGIFLRPPTLQMREGRWVVIQPERGPLPGGGGLAAGWATREEAFDHETRDETPLAKAYRAVVDAALDEAEADAKENGAPPVAALVMECVLHGAGGMDLIDPTFQRATIQACRARGLPVVLDEVFAGIWRLGAEGAWELLGEKPDVSCYAKLFTGGLTPLAATATTEEVFDAFRGPTKQNALLHGHSYTAYPIGCAVAAEAQRMYRDPLINDNLVEMGGGDARAALRELWDEHAARAISALPCVKGVTVIGCVLAIELEDSVGGGGGGGGGYSSTAARDVVLRLRARSIQARPLGNVLYLMCAPTTDPARCYDLIREVWTELSIVAAGDDDDW